MIDAESYPGAWQEAIDRGCLSQSIARCRACGATNCACPDAVFQGVIPAGEPEIIAEPIHIGGASL